MQGPISWCPRPIAPDGRCSGNAVHLTEVDFLGVCAGAGISQHDSANAKRYAVYHCLPTFPAQAVYLPGSSDFRIRSTESMVFQLRVVAGAPKSLSIWPR